MNDEYNQREALFGSRSARTNPPWEHRQRDAAVVEVLESINDNKIQDLEARVGELKDVSLKLRDEVQESNTLLGGMTTQFDRVGGMLKMSLRRLNILGSFKVGCRDVMNFDSTLFCILDQQTSLVPCLLYCRCTSSTIRPVNVLEPLNYGDTFCRRHTEVWHTSP